MSTLHVKLNHITIADFLGLNFPAWSAVEIVAALRAGHIQLNGRRLSGKPDYLLRRGDTVTLLDKSARSEPPAQDTPLPLEILYQDAALLIVNKPAGMLSHPSPQEKEGTLLHAVGHYLLTRASDSDSSENLAPNAKLLRPFLLHRLDRDTSGVIALARTPQVARRLSADFEQRRVRKRYLALVKGVVTADEGLIDAPVAATPQLWPRWRVAATGQTAQTRFTVLQRGPQHTLLQLEPLTGRTHQLRLHCAHLGHPILGERIYRGSQTLVRGPQPQAPRTLLHAHSLALPHPMQNKQCLEIVAPYPPDLLQALTDCGLRLESSDGGR